MLTHNYDVHMIWCDIVWWGGVLCRVWMCTDGMVIRQPCSRVAVRRCVEQLEHADGSTSAELRVCPDSGTLNGYTQFEVSACLSVCLSVCSQLSTACAPVSQQGDRDAMSLAELWLGRDFRQDVLQHRLTGRLPYTVRVGSLKAP